MNFDIAKESFSVWGNGNLTGHIPDSLYNLTMLEDLHLFRNSFSGSISEQIGRLTKLKMLMLAENNFTGTLPTELGLCHDLGMFLFSQFIAILCP